MQKMFEHLDKVLMALFAAGALVVGVVMFRDDLPGVTKKYKDAVKESGKDWGRNSDDGSNDPEGYVTVGVIRDGRPMSVRMKRRERDELLRKQSGGR